MGSREGVRLMACGAPLVADVCVCVVLNGQLQRSRSLLSPKRDTCTALIPCRRLLKSDKSGGIETHWNGHILSVFFDATSVVFFKAYPDAHYHSPFVDKHDRHHLITHTGDVSFEVEDDRSFKNLLLSPQCPVWRRPPVFARK